MAGRERHDKKELKVSTSITISPKLLKEVKEEARRRRWSVSVLIEQALIHFNIKEK